MPKKSASKNKKRSATRVRAFKAWCKEHSVGLFIAMSLGVIIVGTATTAWIQADHEVTQAKKGMATYLHNKYGKEFVVENYRIEGDSFGSEGDPTADAYAKDDSALRFEVWDRGKYLIGQHVHSDDYLRYVWSKEARQKSFSYIQTTFPENEGFSIEAGPVDTVKFEFLQGITPTFEEALEKYGDQMFYRVSIRAVVDPADTEPSNDRLQQALKLARYVAGYSVQLPELYYNYRYSDFSAHDNGGNPLYQYSFAVKGQEVQGITSVENIKEYYKKLK